MEITAAGMEAETVMPANNPRYALAPARITAKRIPRITAFTVISGRWESADMNGLKREDPEAGVVVGISAMKQR
jgi:hypothetical protein